MSARLEHLRVDHLKNPLAVARRTPRFGWHVVPDGDAGLVQEAYRITIRTRWPAPGSGVLGGLVADTGRVDTADCVAVEVPGFAGAEGVDYTWTLQVWVAGAPERLVSDGTFGVGVTSWLAPWVEPAQDPVVAEGPVGLSPAAVAAGTPTGPLAKRLHPPRYLRHRFRLAAAPVLARLRITSQGVHQPYLNGRPVGDGLLAPGYESYQHAISVLTHDVTEHLAVGDNVLGVILGDGWYAGRISFLGRSAQYGDMLRASWQLEVTDATGTRRVIVPDEDVVSSRGPIDWSDIFIGERHDARAEIPGWHTAGFAETDRTWTRCRTVPVEVRLVPFAGEPIRRVRELPVRRILGTPAGETVLDFGQVMAGRVRMSVRGAAGTVVRLEHAEVIDTDGNFLDNIHGVNKDQADEYVLAGRPAGETWEPLFTFHGFRYVKLIGYPGTPRPQDFVAVVIANDLESTAGFSCSDPRLDQLFANTVWSQRSNFLAVPTDCPQRERAGWTGDLQIFAATAATLMGVAAFLDRWLGNVRVDQRAHGGVVPVIVPEPPAMAAPSFGEGDPFSEIKAAAGWADVITIAPWALYRHYGDTRFLADNLQAMRDWVGFQTRDARDQLPPRLRGVELTPERRARHDLLWNGRMHFGDWLAPSTMEGYKDDPYEAIMRAPRLTSELVGPMFQVRSLDLLAATAEVLGDHGLARDCRDRAAAVRGAFAAEYVADDGRIAPDLQGIYVLALAFDMVPALLRPAVVARLVELVHAAGDHLDTGFLSVAHLLDVLCDNGEADLARTLLLQDTAPSWLYEVKMGATSIWETWRAVHEDGSAEMASMNHYAFGCVVDWMMRRLAGIDQGEPGYRTSRIAPDLDGFLDSCTAHVDTPYGRLAVEWRRGGREADITVSVPVGATARVALPPGWRLESGSAELSAGRHRLRAGACLPGEQNL